MNDDHSLGQGLRVRLRVPTLDRYRALFPGQGQSILRILQYEYMDRVGLSGLVLDFGGGGRVNYQHQLAAWGAGPDAFIYESANINPQTEPTFLLNPDAPLPISDGVYDTVISLNTLEHVYALERSLHEMARVLKPGGRLILTVPFMFRVHGHPDDFHRGTPSFWKQMLTAVGFGDIDVEALVWGPFSTGQAISGLPGPFKSPRRHAGLLLDILYGIYRFRHADEVAVPPDAPAVASAPGFGIEAWKR
ncbi:MAG: class I SAM-dependent methyltransferase [Rhodospirillales bacterium]